MNGSEPNSTELRHDVEAVTILISKLQVYSQFDTQTPTERAFPSVFSSDSDISDSIDSNVGDQLKRRPSSILRKMFSKSKKLLPKLQKR
ncbi:hypothetical protein KDRO_D05610 [Kluyveromyces lactis]|nr:hypothetical protein KDRO_D05610 [Kluyveromyces lactis]